MKLCVLALDYDGSIARGDRMCASAAGAIAAARRRGIKVLLVTGRILGDLRRVAGPLGFVDVVVAENGALVHFPEGGHTTFLAPAVPAASTARLLELGVPFHAGECLVDADAALAPRLLRAIRELELPIALLFNRSRVMAVTQGISKAAGPRPAITTSAAAFSDALPHSTAARVSARRSIS
jgi:hydroxymethylpyrimidine pyrophosphatase-like HAD family hydrolase